MRGSRPKPVPDTDGSHNTSIALRRDQERALDERAGELGITRSEVMREIMDQWLSLGRPPLERGYMAGWRAGYREFMRRVANVGVEMTHELDAGLADIGGLSENP